jgi:hypothetical protein
MLVSLSVDLELRENVPWRSDQFTDVSTVTDGFRAIYKASVWDILDLRNMDDQVIPIYVL